MIQADNLVEEVRALERLDLERLREAWRQRLGPPPQLRSADLVRRLLAWKLQAHAHGGLDAETRRLLRSTGAARGPCLAAGTRIAREWKGVRYDVDVVAGGYVYGDVR